MRCRVLGGRLGMPSRIDSRELGTCRQTGFTLEEDEPRAADPPAEPPATPTPNAPDMPASLPECRSTKKMTATAIGT